MSDSSSDIIIYTTFYLFSIVAAMIAGSA